MKTKLFIFITFILITNACSTSKFQYQDTDPYPDKVETKNGMSNTKSFDIVSIEKIYCWVNILPGIEQISRFYISGSITIPRSDNYDFDDISLKLIKIYQNSHPYLVIKPAIRENKREKSEYQKEFIFSTYLGKKLVAGFNSDENIDIEFIFDNDGEMASYKVLDQIIEKAN